MRVRLFSLLAFTLSVLLAPLGAAEAAADAPVVVPAAMFTPPNPAVLAYARQAGLALEGVARQRAGPARPADTVVALATFFEGEKQRQWLIRFTVAELEPAEKKEKPGSNLVLYTTTGRAFTFTTQRTALALETTGPFAAGVPAKETPPTKRARAVVNEEFLAIGLYRATEIFAAFRAFETGPGKGEDFSYGFGDTAFPATKTAAGKILAERIGLTEEMERSFGGSIPALMEFFQIARETPGVRDILMAVLDKPPIWSLAKSVATGNLNAGIGFAPQGQGAVDASAWPLGLKQLSAVALNVQLVGKPALDLTLYAGDPQPPLRTTAGIVGLIAKSIKTPSRFVVIRILSTQSASETTHAQPDSR